MHYIQISNWLFNVLTGIHLRIWIILFAALSNYNHNINIIANHFKIPLVLFSKNKLAESKKTMSKNENIFVSYSDNSKNFYFINVEQKYNKYIYKLVVLPDNNSLISLDKLRLNDYKRDIRNNIKLNNFNTYISENKNSVVKTNKKIKLN